MPAYREDNAKQFRRSSHSLDGELEGPQPNSIALQMSYPLVNAPPPPLQVTRGHTEHLSEHGSLHIDVTIITNNGVIIEFKLRGRS